MGSVETTTVNMESLIEESTQKQVSSIMNRAVKTWGPRKMFDNDDETCWNSGEGSPQWIRLKFEKPVTIDELRIQFQGGFVGKECHIETVSVAEETSTKVTDFYPEDKNSLQIFSIEEKPTATQLKIVFKDSTDFYGRITIYKLDVLGTKT